MLFLPGGGGSLPVGCIPLLPTPRAGEVGAGKKQRVGREGAWTPTTIEIRNKKTMLEVFNLFG